MRKIILLKSRYGEIHRLERIGGRDSHLFLFIPADDYYRLGLSVEKEDSYDFVDPSGGPFIHAGNKIGDISSAVKTIYKNKEGKIILEFE